MNEERDTEGMHYTFVGDVYPVAYRWSFLLMLAVVVGVLCAL